MYTKRAVHENEHNQLRAYKMITIEYKWTTEKLGFAYAHSKRVDFDTDDDLHALELAERFKANIIPANALTAWFDYA